MKILIDNGHGIQTKGKRSPDGKLLEYAYTRELARQIVATLKARGHDAELLVPEDDDIPLAERVRRINAVKSKYSTNNFKKIRIPQFSETKFGSFVGLFCLFLCL